MLWKVSRLCLVLNGVVYVQCVYLYLMCVLLAYSNLIWKCLIKRYVTIHRVGDSRAIIRCHSLLESRIDEKVQTNNASYIRDIQRSFKEKNVIFGSFFCFLL